MANKLFDHHSTCIPFPQGQPWSGLCFFSCKLALSKWSGKRCEYMHTQLVQRLILFWRLYYIYSDITSKYLPWGVSFLENTRVSLTFQSTPWCTMIMNKHSRTNKHPACPLLLLSSSSFIQIVMKIRFFRSRWTFIKRVFARLKTEDKSRGMHKVLFMNVYSWLLHSKHE